MPGIFPSNRLLLVLGISFALAGCQYSDTPPVSRGKALPAAYTPVNPGNTGNLSAALPDFSQLVLSTGPMVVNVVTIPQFPGSGPGVASDPHHGLFRRFMPGMPPPGSPEPEERGVGSGFIISQDGLILTNAHVVAHAGSVTVRLADGKREYAAKVLGADSRSDIALLKIDATGLPMAKLGSGTSVQPGQWVVAIGSPFGFANTITAGVVSATNRELPNETMISFIQTDVAVNPGNSGSPLINMAGEVVGVNSMIYSRTGGYMGVSFAIPIEAAMAVAKQLQEKGKVTRGHLGIVTQALDNDLAQAVGLENTDGALVSAVEQDGPAARAGMRSGDVVLEYDGKPITNPVQLPRLVAGSRPGSSARVTVWRAGTRHEMNVKIG
jgi:serine protease Do